MISSYVLLGENHRTSRRLSKIRVNLCDAVNHGLSGSNESNQQRATIEAQMTSCVYCQIWQGLPATRTLTLKGPGLNQSLQRRLGHGLLAVDNVKFAHGIVQVKVGSAL